MRNDMKKRLHSAHMGYDSMMRRARDVIFWPGMSQDIKQLADSCEACQELKPRTQKETLKQHDNGEKPWVKIGLDLFEIQGRTYLVVIDYYSNFIEIELMQSITSAKVINSLKKQFARFGIPNVMISDGGPQLSSYMFKDFTDKWGITHTFSSPGHQQANGKAESAVKIMKNLLKKTLKEGGDPYEALLEQRNTPRQDTGLSPAQMMFGRNTRSMIPVLNNKLPLYNSAKRRAGRSATVKRYHDKTAHDMCVLEEGQTVFFQHKEGKQWRYGTIIEKCGDRTYIVKSTDTGGTYRRNRLHIRPTKCKVARDDSPVAIRVHDETELVPDDEPGLANDIGPIPDIEVPVLPERGNQPQNPLPVMNERPVRHRTKPGWMKDYV